MRILALEPYYGGSHRAFLDTWVSHSSHDWELLTLEARHWKWRMRGSAIWFAQQLRGGAAVGRYDLIFTCDMTSVADLRALLPPHLKCLPIVCYFHENQLTYPLSPDDTTDYQYGFTNITSALAADAVWFNSQAHCDAFLEETRRLLKKMPDYVTDEPASAIQSKVSVHYPAIDHRLAMQTPHGSIPAGPVRILWCHRWEYDKNPQEFFDALAWLDEERIDFEVNIVGEQFRTVPAAFAAAYERLKPKVRHAGYLPSSQDYWAKLRESDVVASTAIQENFGIAVVEAMAAGCYPLLPRRLSYPELLSESKHSYHLYNTPRRFRRQLRELCLAGRARVKGYAAPIQQEVVSRFGVASQVPRLDQAISGVVEGA